METPKDSLTKKGKRPKSATRYPKKMPTYVVAFAFQETRDEPPTDQQNQNKYSIESIFSSGPKVTSPTGSSNSTKTFTVTPTEVMSQFNVPTISEVKIDIIDENECGDIEKKSPQISSYFVANNIAVDEQPKILFNATRHVKRSKENGNLQQNNTKFQRKKPKKSKRVPKFKSIHFKYKNSKNNITRRLEKYYEKTPNAEQIQKQICSNELSKVVSRSRILKKVLARENLLDDSDRSIFDSASLNGNDDTSPSSSPSTTKKSFVSYTSQNTLIQKSSSTSRNEDIYTVNNTDSVIQVRSEVSPYRNDIFNVAIAVAYNPSKPDEASSTEKFMHKENLTSEETSQDNLRSRNTTLTSAPPSNENSGYDDLDLDQIKPVVNEKDVSNETLTENDNRSLVAVSSDDDTFVIARTSSEFNQSSIFSNFTLTSTSEPMASTISKTPNLVSKNLLNNDIVHNKRTTLCDTVLNIGFYPEVTASTSSAGNFNNYLNDVIVTDNVLRNYPSYPINIPNKGDIHTEAPQKLSKVLKKSFVIDNRSLIQKNINLPDDAAIKAELNEKAQKRADSAELKTVHPIDMKEMWEQLTTVLQSAVKRLEDTLVDKIIKELKKTTIFDQRERRLARHEIKPTECEPITIRYEESINMSHKEVFVDEDLLKVETDACLQCNLVQNRVIDQLMLKLSVERPKPVASPTPSLKKLMKPEVVKDYFEILKPPDVDTMVDSLVEVGRGKTVTVSTATAEIRAQEESFRCLKILISGPLAFIRQNWLVITSIPTFFVVMLCLYGIVFILIKPW